MIDELKDTLREVMTIKDKIRFCYSRGSILQSDKDEVVQLFEQSDIKITCLEQLFVSAFDAETKAARSELRQIYLSYWKFTTGSELMNSKFSSISDDFFRRHNETFMTLESKIKQTMNKVHRL
jgi:hypothetical protein